MAGSGRKFLVAEGGAASGLSARLGSELITPLPALTQRTFPADAELVVLCPRFASNLGQSESPSDALEAWVDCAELVTNFALTTELRVLIFDESDAVANEDHVLKVVDAWSNALPQPSPLVRQPPSSNEHSVELADRVTMLAAEAMLASSRRAQRLVQQLHALCAPIFDSDRTDLVAAYLSIRRSVGEGEDRSAAVLEELNNAKEELSNAQQVIDRYKAAISMSHDNYRETMRELNECEAAYSELQGAQRDLQEENRAISNEVLALREECGAIKGELSQYKAIRSDLQAAQVQLSENQDTISKLEDELAALRDSHRAALGELSEHRSTNLELRAYEKQFLREQDANSQLNAAVLMSLENYRGVVLELDSCKADIEVGAMELRDKQKRIQKLETAMARLSFDLEMKQLEADAVRADRDNHAEALAQMRSSTSWKLTSPIRAVKGSIGGVSANEERK